MWLEAGKRRAAGAYQCACRDVPANTCSLQNEDSLAAVAALLMGVVAAMGGGADWTMLKSVACCTGWYRNVEAVHWGFEYKCL